MTQARGMGWEVAQAYLTFFDATQGLKRGYYALPYSAKPVTADVLNSTGQQEFFASIQNGWGEITRFILGRQLKCPDEHYVLAGYSQGAMGIHRYIRELGATSEIAELGPLTEDKLWKIRRFRRIDGAIAIADGDRLSSPEIVNYGTAGSDGYGVAFAVYMTAAQPGDSYSIAPLKPWFPSSMAERFHSICALRDYVCNQRYSEILTGIAVHTSAYSPPKTALGGEGDHVEAVRQAARAVARVSKSAVASGPPRVLGPAALPMATEGERYSVDLDQYSQDPVTFHIVKGSLPAGLSLDVRSGEVSGMPTGSGQAALSLEAIDQFGKFTLIETAIEVQANPCGGSDIPAEECQALRDLASANTLSELGWPGLDPNIQCSWSGVECSGGHVVGLSLPTRKLVTIPPSIGSLSSLRYLDLYGNQISTLPAEFSQLTSLESLSLNSNEIGVFPASIAPLHQLIQLDLNFNKLGSIPGSIGGLTRLEKLTLAENHISAIPDSLGALQNLRHLDVRANAIATLPPAVGDLTSIQSLYVSQNLLIGDVSSWAKNLSIQHQNGLEGALLVDDNKCLTTGGDSVLEAWMTAHARGWPGCPTGP